MKLIEMILVDVIWMNFPIKETERVGAGKFGTNGSGREKSKVGG